MLYFNVGVPRQFVAYMATYGTHCVTELIRFNVEMTAFLVYQMLRILEMTLNS